MKEPISFQGRSMVFNALLVVLNLTGLTFMVLGGHDNFVEQSTMFNFIGLILMIASIGGLIILKGRMMMSSVSRVLVGGLFIVSGLVKANDPVGFSYKLEEYFEDGALAFRIKEWFGAPSFSMEFLMDWALALSIIICIVEIVLGVLTLIGGKIKLVSYLMLLMMLFFTFLTWHTANCDSDVKFLDRDTYEITDPIAVMKMEQAKTNPEISVVSKPKGYVVIDEMKQPQCVDDCGCFGDALKGSVGRSLTPNESLWKDIILLYLVIWIFVAQWIIQPNNKKQNLVYTVAGMAVITFFSWVFGWYFPILFGLLAILGALWIKRVGGKILGNFYGSILMVTLLCILMVTYVMMYTPLKDYRPYAVGSDLNEKMNDGIEGVYQNLLVYKNKKTGEKKEYDGSSDEYVSSKIWEDKDWEYLDMVQKAIVPSKNPSIMDFNPVIGVSEMIDAEKNLPFVKAKLDSSQVKLLKILSLEYDSEMLVPFEEYDEVGFPVEEYTILDTVTDISPDLTDIEIKNDLLTEEKVVVVISRKLGEGNWSVVNRLKEIQKACAEQNIPMLMICNATRGEINEFRKEHALDLPVFAMDEIELKIISRSNPAVLVLEKGVIKAKYAYRTIPTGESFSNKHLNQ